MKKVLDGIETKLTTDDDKDIVVTSTLRFTTQSKISREIVSDEYIDEVAKYQQKMLAHFISERFYGELYRNLCRLQSSVLSCIDRYHPNIDEQFSAIIDWARELKENNE